MLNKFKPSGYTGSCRFCGTCCKSFYLRVVCPYDDVKQKVDWVWWLSLHEGVTIEKKLKNNQFLIKINNQCGELMLNNYCALHPKKPDICKDEVGFPTVKLCGFQKR